MQRESNMTGIEYGARDHLPHAGTIVDIHAHVMMTRPGDPKDGPPLGVGPNASVEQAEMMLEAGQEFGVRRTYSMCYPDDIAPLRERFGEAIGFNGSISKKKADDPDDDAYRLLDRFLELGIEMIKFWSAPRGRERGLHVDAPWRIEALKRARSAGIRVVMVHVGDPDRWFESVYLDRAKFGTKMEQYVGFRRMLEEFSDVAWIAAHMGGDPEHPDHLQELIETYPHLHFDTSATKWQVREVSPRRAAIRALLLKYPERFLFGTDNVTRHGLDRDLYVSRYWCQRTLWESAWEGRSPIADPDYVAEGTDATPLLRGLDLPENVLRLLYHDNAARLLGRRMDA